LIESLLVYSRVTASERGLEIVELEDALVLAKQNLALSIEGTDAVIECHTPLPVMRADRIQLIQLFQNLSSNAIKLASGGRICYACILWRNRLRNDAD